MKEALQKYINNFERLQDDKIDDLLSIVSENFIFEDPFQKIKGKNEFKALLKNMFIRLKKPKFKITMVYEHKLVNVVKWNFSCEFLKKTISFSGISEIYIRGKLVTKHVDYWDSGRNFYSHLPIIGSIFRRIHK
jgi:steroid delta-isomerase